MGRSDTLEKTVSDPSPYLFSDAKEYLQHPRHGVGIVLVNWNGAADTLECLASLKSMHIDTPWACCIVDNNSQDGSTASISQYFTNSGFTEESIQAPSTTKQKIRSVKSYSKDGFKFIVVSNHDNWGFATANNLGFEVLNELFHPAFYWVLNNDTIVEPDALSLMLKRIARDNTIGMCGCTLVHTNPNLLIQAHGGVRYSTWSGKGVHVGEGRFYDGPVDNAAIESQITYVSGASMVITSDFLLSVGPMCEDYFLYNEELDWAWRSRGKFKIAVETAAVVHHKEGASIGTHGAHRAPSLLSDFYQTRNKLLFARKYTPLKYPVVFLFSAVRALKRFNQGLKSNANVISAALLGKSKPNPEWFPKRVNKIN